MKKLLGLKYTSEVLKILDNRKVVNRIGGKYTSGSVRNVMAGKQQNIQIENAIYDLAFSKRKVNEDLEDKRKQLLNN
ncbi:hypothetical protein [Aquimarina litoralis]|uniref:hypothetical protein n=1 Tax=Aquimarina litoralis TaxID=584605 RepID=UPI001C59C425|nr:hypothetical protein [Aquimarina litoralis]MBW1296422.1 hypothetical protein [Aquimarina litoralis]